jgi:hypothetical protein
VGRGGQIGKGSALCTVVVTTEQGASSDLVIRSDYAGTVVACTNFTEGQGISSDIELLVIEVADQDLDDDLPRESRQGEPPRLDSPEDLRATLQPGRSAVARQPSATTPPAGRGLYEGNLAIPGYEHLSEIGNGASGRVYKAIESTTRKECALKFFHSKEIFEKEWQATERIRRGVSAEDRHLFVLLEQEVNVEGRHVASMPFQPWPTLKAVIKDNRTREYQPTSEQIRSLLQELLRAAGRLHASRLIHRDLKPENVFVRFDRQESRVEVKLSDFTICYSEGEHIGREDDVRFNTAGTNDYMAPESRESSPPVPEPRLDIYSIGIIGYEFACGKPPTVNARMPSEVRSARDLEWLDAFYRKATAPDPSDRAEDAKALSKMLPVHGGIADAYAAPPDLGKRDGKGKALYEQAKAAANAGRRADAENLYRRAGDLGFTEAWIKLVELTWKIHPKVALDACARLVQSEAAKPADMDRATLFKAVISSDRSVLSLSQWDLAKIWMRILEHFDVIDIVVPSEVRESSKWDVAPRLPWRIRHRGLAADFLLVSPLFNGSDLKPFYLGETTVTQEQWSRIHPLPVGLHPMRSDLPVHSVSWEQTTAFAAATGLELPTSAEWEFACRAGSVTAFSCGGTLEPQFGNCDHLGAYSGKPLPDAQWPSLAPGRSGKPNPWGFFQMHGNLWEWCRDEVPNSPRHRVRRGGSFADPPDRCSSTSRDQGPQDRAGLATVGLRLAWHPPSDVVRPEVH